MVTHKLKAAYATPYQRHSHSILRLKTCSVVLRLARKPACDYLFKITICITLVGWLIIRLFATSDFCKAFSCFVLYDGDSPPLHICKILVVIIHVNLRPTLYIFQANVVPVLLFSSRLIIEKVQDVGCDPGSLCHVMVCQGTEILQARFTN